MPDFSAADLRAFLPRPSVTSEANRTTALIAIGKKALGVRTDADAVRASLGWVAEMEDFWRFMRRTRGKLRPGSLAQP